MLNSQLAILLLWHFPASPYLNFASIRCLGWDKDCLGSFIDHHRVLLLAEPVFIHGFLLVQLTCLVSEFFPPFLQVSGHGLSVMGSCGCVCQTADDRLGRQGSSFFSGYWFLPFFFFFKVHIDFKFWGESTPRNDGELLNLGDALDIHREVSLMDQGHPASLHASQAWIALWSASVPQDVYFATPFPVWKMDSIILPYPVGSRRLITEGGKVLWCHKKD